MASVHLWYVIGIGPGILARWQRSDTTKPSVLARGYWLDGKGLGGLPETIEPDVCTRLERFWNNWGLGEGLSWDQDKRSAKDSLIHRKYRHESDDEDLGGWCMKSRSPHLIGVLGWDDFHRTSIEISLPIILYLVTWIPPFSEKSRLHTFSGIRTFVHVTSELDILSNHVEHPWSSTWPSPVQAISLFTGGGHLPTCPEWFSF